MKYELIHDTIAQQVFDKASTEARTRRKVERYVRERYAAYQERGARLTQDDVDFVRPYLSQINISLEEAAFLERERQTLRRRKRNLRLLIGVVILALLSLTAWAQLESEQAAKSEERAQTNAQRAEQHATEAFAAKRQDSLRAIDLGIALEAADQAKRADSLKAIELGLALNEANLQRLAAERRTLELQARSLVEEAAKLPREDKELALRLAQAAYEMSPSPPPQVQQKLAEIFYRQLRSEEHVAEPLPIVKFKQNSSFYAQYSPDRQYILLGYGPDLALYRPNGQLIWTLPNVGSTWAVEFAPNSQWIAFSNKKKVEVYDVNKQHITTIEGHENSISSIAFSPDSKRVVTCAYQDSIAKVWGLDGRFLFNLEEHRDRVYSSTFSADGAFMATASEDQTAIIWNAKGEVVALLPDHEASVTSVQFSPNRQLLFTTAESQVGRLWNTQGELLATFAENAKVHQMQFSPDGEQILTSEFGGDLSLWDLEGNLLSSFDDCRGTIRSLCFSPDGRMIGAASVDGRAKVWDIVNGRLLVDIIHQDRVHGIQFSPNGQQVLTSSGDGTAKISTLTPPLFIDFNLGRIRHTEFAPDGRSFITTTGSSAHLWNHDGELLRTMEGTRHAFFLPSSNQLFTNGLTKAFIRDLSGQPLLEWPNPDSAYYNYIVVSPDEQLFCDFYSRKDGEPIRIFNSKGQVLNQWQAHEKRTTSVAFSSNSQKLLTTSIREEARLWDLDGQLLLQIQTDGQFKAAVLSPDGQHIATRETYGTVKIRDLAGNLIAETPRSTNYRSIQFSPDGTYLAICDTENLYLWDIKSWSMKTQIPNAGDSYVTQFSPDGQFLLTKPGTQSVNVWNLAGELIAEFNGHSGLNTRTVFSPDGDYILSTSDDETVKLWPLPQRIYDYLKNEAAIPDLTEGQRRLYGIN